MTLDRLRRAAHWLLLAGAAVIILLPDTRPTWFGDAFVTAFWVLTGVNVLRSYLRGELSQPMSKLHLLPLDNEMIILHAWLAGAVAAWLVSA